LFRFRCRYKKNFEDIKGIITIRTSKDTQRNCQKINNKRTNNDIQDTIQNTKDWQIRSTIRTGLISCAPKWCLYCRPFISTLNDCIAS
jgi:hypothetical protein